MVDRVNTPPIVPVVNINWRNRMWTGSKLSWVDRSLACAAGVMAAGVVRSLLHERTPF